MKFYFKKKKGELLPFVSDPMFVEILGNKYENPELLEGADENQWNLWSRENVHYSACW